MVRLLSDDELAELSRPPVGAAAERGWRRGVEGYAVWRELTVASLTDAISTDAGADADAAFATAHEQWTPWPTSSNGDDSDDEFDRVAAHWRREHDRGLDAVCAQITHVYRTHGIDVLEQSIRAVGEKTLLAWMPKDIERPPEVRIRTWAAMLHGNFAEFTIAEDDARFVITQDPCGSCGRQLECGAFPGPLEHATVSEVHPITFERGNVPVYRTHVAVMHFLMPTERLGVPWPVVACPRGSVPGPCRITLYKDPRNPAARRDAEALRAPVKRSDADDA
jgi:hypothetical protein